eukprot:14935963-Ditylum_brightwellii.AAC.1
MAWLPKKSYFTVVFHTETHQIQFQGPCNGAATFMTSYRAEMTGILAVLYVLCVLDNHSDKEISTQQVLYCDNSAAVTHANMPLSPGIKSHMVVDYDVSREIEYTKDSDIDRTANWVNAHQDNNTPANLLPLDAKLNVMADTDVTIF